MIASRNPDNYCWIADQERFMYAPSRGLWTRNTVIKQVGKEEAILIERERVCSNVTWIPGAPEFIKNTVVVDGELEDFPGNNLFNTFRPARPLSNDANPNKAAFWLDLGLHLFNEEDLERLLDCLAFKVQNPGVKINRGFIIGSREQGIGKDAFIAAVRRAIGPANWGIKSASGVIRAIEKDFTARFLQKTVLQISEVHELGEKRFSAYDSQKDWKAAPPNYLNVADKNAKEHPILNAVLVIQTTNHLTDGPFIPPEDRREDVIWSKVVKADLSRLTKLEPKVYWTNYFDRLNKGGDDEHVAAFLMQRDVSKFMPGEEPPKTEAWKQIVGVNRPTGDAGLLDLLDRMATDWIYATGDLQIRPPALTLDQIKRHRSCPLELAKLIEDKGKARTVAHRLGSAGYATFDNPDTKEGYWRINGKRQVIYTPNELDPDEKRSACEALIRAEQTAISGVLTGCAPEEDFV